MILDAKSRRARDYPFVRKLDKNTTFHIGEFVEYSADGVKYKTGRIVHVHPILVSGQYNTKPRRYKFVRKIPKSSTKRASLKTSRSLGNVLRLDTNRNLPSSPGTSKHHTHRSRSSHHMHAPSSQHTHHHGHARLSSSVGAPARSPHQPHSSHSHPHAKPAVDQHTSDSTPHKTNTVYPPLNHAFEGTKPLQVQLDLPVMAVKNVENAAGE